MKKRTKILSIIFIILAVYIILVITPYFKLPQTNVSDLDNLSDINLVLSNLSDTQVGRAALISDGKEALDVRISLINMAEKRIDLGTFIFSDDESGKLVAGALLSAAERGVQVNIVADNISARIKLMKSGIGLALGLHENIKIKIFNRWSIIFPWRLNSCFHEKYMSVDNRVYLIGGRNIENRFYESDDSESLTETDLEVMIWTEDPSIQNHINDVWNNSKVLTECFENAIFFLKDRYEKKQRKLIDFYDSNKNIYGNYTEEMLLNKTVVINGLGVISNPQTLTSNEPVIWNKMLSLFLLRKEDTVFITPYISINTQMKKDLSLISNNMNLTLVNNSHASGINYVAMSDELIHSDMYKKIGARYVEPNRDKAYHTKAVIVGDEISIIGSFNLDIRSAFIDSELMLVIKGEEFNKLLKNYYDNLNTDVSPVEMKLGKRIILYLLSPLASLFRFLI